VSSEPRAFAAVDRGTATVATALVGRVAGHWRLLGATAGPMSVGPDPLIERLRRRLAEADPELARELALDVPHGAVGLPRIESGTTAPPELAVLAATDRHQLPLAAAAAGAGWVSAQAGVIVGAVAGAIAVGAAAGGYHYVVDVILGLVVAAIAVAVAAIL